MIQSAMKKIINNTPNNNIYISNLSYKRDRNGIRSLCSKFGVIKNIKVVVEPKTLQSKGMAFVEFGSVKEATNALESLDGVIIDGRTVKVNFAFPQTVKPGSTGNVKGKNQKDLEFKEIQIAKKARNDEKRKLRQGFNFAVSKKSK